MIVRAAWVLPVAAPPIRDGYVEVMGDRITAVGPWASRPAAMPFNPARGDIDLGNAVLTPGLVNPHTHLELTCYAGMLPPAPFWEWIARLIVLRRGTGQREREQAAVADGAWRSLRAGVTCVGDISRLNLSWSALKPLPIRKVCFVELLSLADDPPRNPEELRASVTEVIEDDLLTVGVTPHAPYTVPREHIVAAINLAREMGRPWTMHWAETREECGFIGGDEQALPDVLRGLAARRNVVTPRQRMCDYLSRCVADGPAGLLAHVNYVEPGEPELLASSRHTVAYCPRAHRFFGHSPHPFDQLRRAGVPLVFGTDSIASNESLSILDELRYVSTILEAAPAPAELLQMATLDAAGALGLAGLIGSLEPGKQADLAAFEMSETTDDPAAELIARAPQPTAVWVAGTRVAL